VEGTRATYRRVLRERDFRLLITAQTQSAMGGWAYNVALIVYIYDETHSAGWVAAGTLGRMIPRFFASLYAGVVAERMERIRLMVRADAASAVVLAAMAAAAALHAHAAVLIALAALSSVIASVYDPSTAAMVPQLLGEDMLAAGNALLETINNVAIIVGPAVGALVLLVGKPSVVMALDAVTFAISASLVARVRTRSRPTDVTKAGGPLRQMMVGITAITGSANAMILVSFSVVTTALYGVDSVMFVFLSKDKLGTGATGYGYLLVALGVGGIIASFIVNRLAALPRLSAVLAGGMIIYAAPTALLVFVHEPAVAVVIEVVRGVATLVVDVLAMTALQRSLPPELISRVFGVFWALIIAGLSVGAFVTPFALSHLGLDTSLVLAGLIAPAAVVLVYPRLASIDRITAARSRELAPRMRVLEALQIFAAAPQAVLERLAGSLVETTAEPGSAIVTEGDPADALYVLASGQVEVLAHGELQAEPRHIRFMDAPTYFGEIGVIEKIPRTATVRAVGSCELWRIDGELFLAALNEGSPSQLLIQGMAGRLAATHPSRRPSLLEQPPAPDAPATVE
jgi:predicted MFS family arabinose efflux permease